MNARKAKEVLPLIQALAYGKTIQHRVQGANWRDCDNPLFEDWRDMYRVKPEPREFWIVGGLTFRSRTDASEAMKAHGISAEVIHVREVSEGE